MAIVPSDVYTTIFGFVVVIVILSTVMTAEAEKAGLFLSLVLSMAGIWWVWVGVVVSGQDWVQSLTGTVTQIVQGVLFILFALFSVAMMAEVNKARGGKRVGKKPTVSGVLVGFGVGYILFFFIIPTATGWVYALHS